MTVCVSFLVALPLSPHDLSLTSPKSQFAGQMMSEYNPHNSSQDRGRADPAANPLDHSDDLRISATTDVRTDVQSIVEPHFPFHEPLLIDRTGIARITQWGSTKGVLVDWLEQPRIDSCRTGKNKLQNRSSLATSSFDTRSPVRNWLGRVKGPGIENPRRGAPRELACRIRLKFDHARQTVHDCLSPS